MLHRVLGYFETWPKKLIKACHARVMSLGLIPVPGPKRAPFFIPLIPLAASLATAAGQEADVRLIPGWLAIQISNLPVSRKARQRDVSQKGHMIGLTGWKAFSVLPETLPSFIQSLMHIPTTLLSSSFRFFVHHRTRWFRQERRLRPSRTLLPVFRAKREGRG